jgi:hypothetical protein
MKITKEQLDAAEHGEAVVLDEDGKRFVLISGDVYDRVKKLLYDDSEWSDEELRAMLARSAEANGWNEPGMEEYDNYDENRR